MSLGGDPMGSGRGGMERGKPGSRFGGVSEAERERFRKIGEVNRIVSRNEDGPAGTLSVALRRMARIERAMGIDVPAIAMEAWSDCQSHLNYMKAVRERMARQVSIAEKGA